jgi:hypothetical protein
VSAVSLRADACDVDKIDDLSRTIVVCDGKSSSAWNEPEIIGMINSKLTLVGKKDCERPKGRLFFRAFDLFSSHSVTESYLFRGLFQV